MAFQSFWRMLQTGKLVSALLCGFPRQFPGRFFRVAATIVLSFASAMNLDDKITP